MEYWTTITVGEVVLHPVRCDWVRSLFYCHTWSRTSSTTLDPLWEAMTARRLKTFRLTPSPYDSRLNMPLSFAAYVSEWRAEEVAPGLVRHDLTLAMTGPPWRDDDTPVESHDALCVLMGWPSVQEEGV